MDEDDMRSDGNPRPRKVTKKVELEDHPRIPEEKDVMVNKFHLPDFPPDWFPVEDVAVPMHYMQSVPIDRREVKMCIRPDEIQTSASINDFWQVCDPSEVNRNQLFFHTGPVMTVCFEATTSRSNYVQPALQEPDPLRHLKDLALLVQAVNNEPSMSDCELPTNYTVIERKKKQTIFTKDPEWNIKKLDVVGDIDHDMTETVEDRLQCFVHFFPVDFEVQLRTKKSNLKTIFAVACVLGLPGIDVLKCVETVAALDKQKNKDNKLYESWSNIRKHVMGSWDKGSQNPPSFTPSWQQDAFVRRAMNELSVQLQIHDQLAHKYYNHARSSSGDLEWTQIVSAVQVIGLPGHSGLFSWHFELKDKDVRNSCCTLICEGDVEDLDAKWHVSYEHHAKQVLHWRQEHDRFVKEGRLDVKNNLPPISRPCVHDRGLSCGEPSETNFKATRLTGCGSVHDIVRFGHIEGIVCVKLCRFNPLNMDRLSFFPEVVRQALQRVEDCNMISTSEEEYSVLDTDELMPITAKIKNFSSDKIPLPMPLCCEHIFLDGQKDLKKSINDFNQYSEPFEMMAVCKKTILLWNKRSLEAFHELERQFPLYHAEAMTDVRYVCDHLAMTSDNAVDSNSNPGPDEFRFRTMMRLAGEFVQKKYFQGKIKKNHGEVLVGSSTYWRFVMQACLEEFNNYRQFTKQNKFNFFQILISTAAAYFTHGTNWTSLGSMIFMCDGMGLWPHLRRNGHNKSQEFVAHWVKKVQSAGVDSVLAASYDELGRYAVQMLTSKKRTYSFDIRQVRRVSPQALRDLGKIKVQHHDDNIKKYVPPPSDLIGRPSRLTDIKETDEAVLGALCDSIDRDRSSLLESSETTDPSGKNGARIKITTKSIHVGRPILIAHNNLIKTLAEENCWETLRQVTYWMPTAPNVDINRNVRARDELDFFDSTMTSEGIQMMSSPNCDAICATLFFTPYLVGHVLGMQGLLGLSKYHIGFMHDEINKFLCSHSMTALGVLWTDNVTKQNYNRKHRVMIARGNVESCFYRLMQVISDDYTKELSAALPRTTNSLQHSMAETHLCFDIQLETMKATFDVASFFFIMFAVRNLKVPCVPWSWLKQRFCVGTMDDLVNSGEVITDATNPMLLVLNERNGQLLNDEDVMHYNEIRKFVKRLHDDNMFIISKDDGTKPYVTSPGLRNGESVMRPNIHHSIHNTSDVVQKEAIQNCFRTETNMNNEYRREMAVVESVLPFITEGLSCFNFDINEHVNILKAMLTKLKSKKVDFEHLVFKGQKKYNNPSSFFKFFVDKSTRTRLNTCFNWDREKSHESFCCETYFRSQEQVGTSDTTHVAYGFQLTALVVIGSLWASAQNIDNELKNVVWDYFPEPNFSLGMEISDKICAMIAVNFFAKCPRTAFSPNGNSVSVKNVNKNGMYFNIGVEWEDKFKSLFWSRYRKLPENNSPSCLNGSCMPRICPWFEDGLHASHLLHQIENIGGELLRKKNGIHPHNFLCALKPDILAPFRYDLLVKWRYPLLVCGLNNDDSDFCREEGFIQITDEDNVRIRVQGKEIDTVVPVKEYHRFLLNHNLIVLPKIHRPGAVVQDGSGNYGLLNFCYEEEDCFMVFGNAYKANFYVNGSITQRNLTALEALDLALEIRKVLYVDIPSIRNNNVHLSQYIPMVPNGVLEATLWYPENDSDWRDDIEKRRENKMVYCLFSTKGMWTVFPGKVPLSALINMETNQRPIVQHLVNL